MIFLPLFMMLMPVPPAEPAAVPAPAPAGLGTIVFTRSSPIEPTVTVHISPRPGAPAQFDFYRIEDPPRGSAQPVRPRFATSAGCGGSGDALARLETLAAPAVDVPGIGREVETVVMDGARYRLEGRAIHGGHGGTLVLTAESGSPLGDWVDSMLELLEPCWGTAGERG